ncbi:hypothetical protein K491DRAFT_689784 [Lophiostoma macrostomum CBS 122681]|uniref:Vacuolar membrane-associated protein IML1 n=1 Tax=Lophiostoma macrostomum CBS 122681 TaxID=1314788 RepID=A0A6A6TFF2_9PLEO|nr:hypothetical protein K491DRAFT_689784 [Lophiostoma macrostomum CBS 122681]
MSKSVASTKQTRVQKVCTLWTHVDSFSTDDVVFNDEKFTELPAKPGSLVQVIGLKHATAVRDFQTAPSHGGKAVESARGDDSSRGHFVDTHSRHSRRESTKVTLDEHGSVIQDGRELDPERSYIFVAKPLSAEMKSKHPNLQVSIAEKIAKMFGLRNRIPVVVTLADVERYSASHVEVNFRDEYLARADMWRMAIAELSNRTVYRGQSIRFMKSINANIKNIYIDGQSTHSGYFSPTTKPVFRSESARYVLFIQMSKEMWDFDAEGAGEIMFNRVVNGFLPDLFKRWMRTSARHLVTIILFTRMEYRGENPPERPNDTTGHGRDSQAPRSRDYYRVVVSEMASGDWINILYQLKKEFRSFLRDVSLVTQPADDVSDTFEKSANTDASKLVITGKPSSAAQGNVLEAINLAAAQFAKDYIDRDLVRTGISVVVITAGTGVFEVDYNMLKLTTDTLVGSGIGIDLVCLSPMPLHSVPLFKYRSPRIVSNMKATRFGRQGSLEAFYEQDENTPRQHQPNFGSMAKASPLAPPPFLSNSPLVIPSGDTDEWRYAMPHWVDISFWSGPSDELVELSQFRKPRRITAKHHKRGNTFSLRCRMYELQMMGVMENELGDISIPYMEEDPLFPHQLREHLDSFLDRSNERPVQRKSRTLVASGSYSSKDEKDLNGEDGQHTALHKAWMEAYDDDVFSPLSGNESQSNRQSQYLQPEARTKELPLENAAKDNSLSASFRSVEPHLGKTARRPAHEDSHQMMRERPREVYSQSPRGSIHQPTVRHKQGIPRADILYRQNAPTRNKEIRRPGYHQRGNSGDSNDYHGSVHSTPNDSPAASRGNTPPKRSGLEPLSHVSAPTPKRDLSSNRPGNWFLRQISFGGKGASPSKPTTSTATIAIDVTPGQVKPARLTVENNQKGAIAAKLASTRVTEEEKPSKPINIKPVSRSGLQAAESPSSDQAGRSVDTVKRAQPRPSVPSHPGSVTKDPGSTFLLAGSRALAESIGPKFDLSSSGGGKNIPRTLSPTSAIAPWAVLVNPCNPKKNNLNISNQFRRWQHVFPKRLKTSSVKWKSLCSPAAVPLTNEYFPTPDQIATEYNESPYKITQNDDEDVLEAPKSRESLIRELIAFRLSHGFQIVVGSGVAEFTGGREQDSSNILHSEYMANDGDTVFMCVGNTIHQLVCVAGGEVEVKRFNRKPTTALQSSAGIDTPLAYKPFIRTALDNKYHSRDVVLRPPRKEYNWNFIDTFLAGYRDEFSEVLRFWRARFVLIPVEIPTMNRRPLPLLTEDSEEEIRLEGIRKLTQVWQRHRYIPPEERHFHATNNKKLKDPNPLAIEYHTRDPSAIVAAGPDSALLNDVENDFPTALFAETDQYNTSNIDLKRLAEDLQGDKGIRMMDRRWHWRLHYNCFIGFDLTSWLLTNFKDVETRDEAVDLGNQLMNKGLFQHVQKRHQFRDGNFFYQIAADYRAPRPELRSGWFGMRRTDRSVPSTPLSEGPRTSPLTSRSLKSRPSTSDSSSTSGSIKDGEKTPTRLGTPKRKVTLSRVMRYDVDSRRRSYRPEIISLHYDRLHNPDNCYHIRIDWMNVTAKLIEDAIVTWATNVEKYGLKLVEVPIAEASNIIDHHPFRSPYTITLALQPPQALPEQVWDASHFSPQPRTDKYIYHKALLRKLDFVLDMEAASSFPPDVDVNYSWGNPDYKYTQFIHRSGVLLAQITSPGTILLLANRLAHNRAKDTTKFRHTDPYEHKRSTTTTTTAASNPTTPAIDRGTRSPFSSPLARPVQDSSLLHTALQDKPQPPPQAHMGMPLKTEPDAPSRTPEQLKDDIEAFCGDPVALRQFYDEAFRQAPEPSPRVTPMLEGNIPSLGLPPAISIREASPAQGGGWAGLGMGGGGGVVGTPRVESVGVGAGRRMGSEGSAGGGGEREREREGQMQREAQVQRPSGMFGRRVSVDVGSLMGFASGGAGGGSESGSLPKRQDSTGSSGSGAGG